MLAIGNRLGHRDPNTALTGLRECAEIESGFRESGGRTSEHGVVLVAATSAKGECFHAQQCALLLLFAILPSLLFVGHSPSPDSTRPDARADVSHSSKDHREHARHCHENLTTCSDQPVSSGPGQFLLSGDILPVPQLPALRVSAPQDRFPASFIAEILVPPPRAVI